MRRLLIGAVVVAFGAAGSTACATKGYVRNQVGQVSTKVDTLSTSLEQTQERTRQNEAKITEVDTKAGAAATAAAAADSKAVAADSKASGAMTAAEAAASRAAEVEKASRRIVYEVVLSEASGNFKFGSTKLPDEGKAQIDTMISKILQDPKGAYFEIEGHTDNVGGTAINEKIGLERAEAVKAYLYEQHKIPLHRMNVISYGEAKPAGPNKTRDERAANRRVVIRVLG